MNVVTPAIRERFLMHFVDAWIGWRFHEKPHSFWVREYSAVGENGPDREPRPLWARRVWLLNDDGIAEKSPLDWRRFECLIEQFGARPFSGGVHEVAMGCFAPVKESDKFYYEEIWGGRWGNGWISRLNASGEKVETTMTWIS